jgi:TPP-dependent pyruvate/acetoin dehydrogenase alpha subunit
MTKEKPTYTTVHWEPLDDPDKFRDADRVEEAQKIPLTDAQRTLQEQENEELKDAQQDKLVEAINDRLGWKLKYEKERKLRQEAENEVILIKGITVTNSPELRAAHKEIESLKADLARAKEDHQFDNLVHKKEIENMNK